MSKITDYITDGEEPNILYAMIEEDVEDSEWCADVADGLEADAIEFIESKGIKVIMD